MYLGDFAPMNFEKSICWLLVTCMKLLARRDAKKTLPVGNATIDKSYSFFVPTHCGKLLSRNESLAFSLVSIVFPHHYEAAINSSDTSVPRFVIPSVAYNTMGNAQHRYELARKAGSYSFIE